MKHNTAPIRWNTWSENWIDVLSGVLLRINRAVESSNRSVFFALVCKCPSLSFAVYDEAVVIQLSRQTEASSMSLSSASCFVSAEVAVVFKGSHFCPRPALLLYARFPVAVPRAGAEVPTFLWAAKMRVTKWGLLVQHCTLLSRSFILQGTSSVELELKVKLSCFVLVAKPQISSFLSYCFTFCLCLSVIEIEQTVFVFRFSAPSNYWMMIRFWFGACTGTFSVPASFEELCQVVKFCACVSVVPDYYWLCSYSVPSDGCQVNKVWDVLAAFSAYRAFACTWRGRWYLG